MAEVNTYDTDHIARKTKIFITQPFKEMHGLPYPELKARIKNPRLLKSSAKQKAFIKASTQQNKFSLWQRENLLFCNLPLI